MLCLFKAKSHFLLRILPSGYLLLLLLRSSSQHDFLFSLHRVVLKFSLKHAHLHTPGTWALRQDVVASKRPHPPREWKEVKKETAVQLILSGDVFL